MKRSLKKRVMSVVMTLLMVMSLLPANFLFGGVIEVQADTVSGRTWDFRNGNIEFPPVEKSQAMVQGLTILATNGKFAYNNNASSNEWVEVQPNTSILVPVTGKSELTLYVYNGQGTVMGKFTVDGQEVNNTTQTFTCEGTDGYATIECTQAGYIGSISVVSAPAMAPIGTTGSYDFTTNNGNTGGFFGVDVMPDYGVLSSDGYVKFAKEAGNSQNLTTNGIHGVIYKGNVSFQMEIPANSKVDFAMTKCQHNPADGTISIYADGVEVAGTTQSIGNGECNTDTVKLSYINSSDNPVKVKFLINAPSTSYLEKITYSVSDKPDTATVKGSLTGSALSAVKGEKLWFADVSDGTKLFSATIGDDGSYTVDLPVGTIYSVYLSKAGYSIPETAKADLAFTSVGGTEELQPFEVSYSDPHQAMSINGSGSNSFVGTGVFGTATMNMTDAVYSGDGCVKTVLEAGAAALHGSNHGIYISNNSKLSFMLKIPAQSVANFTLQACKEGNNLKATTYVGTAEDNLSQSGDIQSLEKPAGDGDDISLSYTNKTDKEVIVKFCLEPNGATAYLHGVKWSCTEMPKYATVSGSVATSVNGEKLVFKKDGVKVGEATIANGQYSVELPIGSGYTVEFANSGTYKVSQGGTVDLTNTAAGTTVPNDITFVSWDATKTATVTVGGTTFTITPGASDVDAFNVTASGGDGSVEFAGAAGAIIWANLGGAGNGAVSNVTYGNGASGSVNGNEITVKFAGDTLPESYTLLVKDNSATGIPVKDGATKTYNLGDGSVVSTLYDENNKVTGGRKISSTDKLVTLVANNAISYNDKQHGTILSDTDAVEVKVAGNATISLSLCQYSQPNAILTATAPTGDLSAGSDGSNFVPMQVGKDGGQVTFQYKGGATTILFTVSHNSSQTGQNYIHSITVTNEAEKTTTNEDAVKVKPEILSSVGAAGNLTVTPNGQTLNLVQTGGELPVAADGFTKSFADKGVSFYAFPQTADWNKLELEVKVNSMEAADNMHGVFVGAIAGTGSDASVATVGVRNKTNLRGIYTKAAELAGAGQANTTVAEGETIKYTIYKADDMFYIDSEWSSGTNQSKFKYNDASFAAFKDNGAATPVQYGLMLAGVNVDVTNMKYTDKDGNVLYDQNAYYNPLGEAPVANSASAEAAPDRTYINVTWTGSAVYGDGKYVLQVSKDGAEWTDISDTLTGYSYQYPVASDASGKYKFRVCGTLGSSDEQSVNNRNTYVESNEVTIVAALKAPELTLSSVSPADKVNLSWTVTPQATSYEVYRRSADETKAAKIAAVTGTSYTDTTVTAEVPYYYYIIAKSADNTSNPPKEVWTLPTAGASGEYTYEDAVIAITKKSYDTVFKDKITIEGTVTAPGKVSVLVNGTVAASADVAKAFGTFSFTDVTVAEGRNDVEVILEYASGKKTRKPLNFVYLTNYDYVVDAAFTGTAGDTVQYGVPQFKTVGEALAAVGTGNTSRKVILIREGSYEERLDVYAPYVSLIGEDSTKTIIHNYPGDFLPTGERGGTMGDRAAMRIRPDAVGFSAENLTVQNDWEYKGDGSISNESADVIHSEAEGAMYVNVRFLGYQDTICANKNHQYYYKCYVAGNVDFIYGNSGMAFFNDCDIVFRYNANKNSGYYTAMKNDLTTPYGALFNECRLTAESGCSGDKYYLGRPWGEEAATAFIDCYMSGIVNRNAGFTTWGGKDFATDEEAFEKTRYYEKGSYGAGAMVNPYRRQLSPTQAEKMISASGLGWNPYGEVQNVSSSSYVGTKTTPSDDKFVTDEYESDTYSPYESDDTALGRYDIEGYAQSAATSGGGLLKESNANYYTVANAKEFLDALKKIQSTKRPSVIEITADLNLGSKEVADFASYSSVITAHHVPLTHPALLNSGVSKIDLKGFSDLTIFSSNGSSIKHASIDIKESSNIMIRNITFDELWEWDEQDKGAYDTNDWDYIVIQDGSDRIWIDHCTFYKAYDGIVDIKTNKDTATNVTVSWCEFLPGSENNTFFNAMMDTLAANPGQYPYYQSLLDSGMTKEQVWWYAYGQKKTHLLGQSDDAVQNRNLNVTLANNYYYNSMDRMPRLRFGNAHVYNCIMDAQELYDARASITDKEAALRIVSNGASSTCGGQLLVENSYMNGIVNALNSGNGSSPAGYINAVNSLYYVNGTRYALTPKVNTTKPGETVLLLNADAFVQSLPYSDYVLYDAAQLKTLVVPFAGAGKLTLNTLQWEKGAYIDETWSKPEDNSNYVNDGLPDYVEVETPDGTVVVIGDGIAIAVEKDVVFKDSKGNVITSDKIYVKAAAQEKSPLASMITLKAEDRIKYFDVVLVNEAGDKVTLAGGKITLTFAYPDGTNRFDYSFKVYHGLSSGGMEQLGVSCDDAGIKVKVDSFSPFAVVYTEKAKNPENPDEPGEYEGDTTASVATGDTTPVAPLVLLMTISAGICGAVFFKKKENV